MDNNIQYSEKQIAIFKGINSLTQQGINPYQIKVADIAKAANMGKGTVYDYFSSKEEAISKAILYNVNNEIRSIYPEIMSKEPFKESFYKILNMMTNKSSNCLSMPNILLNIGGANEFYKYLVNDKGDLLGLISNINEMIIELLNMAFDENIISSKENEYYQLMCFKSSISGFMHYINTKDLHPDISIEKAKDLSYKFLLKALN